jgi:DNA replication protein DnaC
MLLKHNLKTLRLPTMLSEYAQLSREAADADENYEQYLLRLTELEVATRTANALAARIKTAGFPVMKDLETYDFSAMPSLSKQKILELARGQWIEENTNVCFIGNPGGVT